MKKHWIALAMLGMLSTMVMAEETAMPDREPEPSSHAAATSTVSTAHSSESETDSAAHPTLSPDDLWAGPMLIIIGTLFLAAAVIGPVVRANTPEAPPESHSHDEEDHGHGHGHAPAHH